MYGKQATPSSRPSSASSEGVLRWPHLEWLQQSRMSSKPRTLEQGSSVKSTDLKTPTEDPKSVAKPPKPEPVDENSGQGAASALLPLRFRQFPASFWQEPEPKPPAAPPIAPPLGAPPYPVQQRGGPEHCGPPGFDSCLQLCPLCASSTTRCLYGGPETSVACYDSSIGTALVPLRSPPVPGASLVRVSEMYYYQYGLGLATRVGRSRRSARYHPVFF